MPKKNKLNKKKGKPTPVNFQQTILNLQKFWGNYGCVILQPYDIEVGAGTFHPATTLRSLGPKPWKAAYVQPSRRPTDGRYGKNPNRLQHYYQFLCSYRELPFLPLYLLQLQEEYHHLFLKRIFHLKTQKNRIPLPRNL